MHIFLYRFKKELPEPRERSKTPVLAYPLTGSELAGVGRTKTKASDPADIYGDVRGVVEKAMERPPYLSSVGYTRALGEYDVIPVCGLISGEVIIDRRGIPSYYPVVQ